MFHKDMFSIFSSYYEEKDFNIGADKESQPQLKPTGPADLNLDDADLLFTD